MQTWAFVRAGDGRDLLEPLELDDCLDVLRAATGVEQSLIVDRLEEARARADAAAFATGGRTEAAAAQRAINIYEPPLHPSGNRALASAFKFLEMHESLADRVRASVLAASRSPLDDLTAAVRDAAERSLARVALGPFEDLRRSLRPGSISSNMAAALEAQFRLPAVGETRALLGALEHAAATKAATHYRGHGAMVRQAIEAIDTPWLSIRDGMRSLAGLVELQDIGHVLNTTPDFGNLAADRLRSYLGDWRASIDWPADMVTDPLVRSDFYLERGLDPALTEFPAAAFDQALTVAGIKRPPPPRLDDYDRAGAPPPDDEETGLQRNNAAHDRLQRLEMHLRRFINCRMTAALGQNWIKHRVPGPMRQEWQDKRDKAVARGEPEGSLIAYADFTDYEKIILRGDNWEEVFKSVFQRQTSVQESLQRLYPIRICTMHARIITQDDQLYLHVEIRRLLQAIGIET